MRCSLIAKLWDALVSHGFHCSRVEHAIPAPPAQGARAQSAALSDSRSEGWELRISLASFIGPFGLWLYYVAHHTEVGGKEH